MNYKITNSGTDALRINIIANAAKQHQKLLRKKAKSREKDNLLDDQIKEIERFFLSPWGQLLSGNKGEYIVYKDREVVREEMERRRKILG